MDPSCRTFCLIRWLILMIQVRPRISWGWKNCHISKAFRRVLFFLTQRWKASRWLTTFFHSNVESPYHRTFRAVGFVTFSLILLSCMLMYRLLPCWKFVSLHLAFVGCYRFVTSPLPSMKHSYYFGEVIQHLHVRCALQRSQMLIIWQSSHVLLFVHQLAITTPVLKSLRLFEL